MYVAVRNSQGEVINRRRLECWDVSRIRQFFEALLEAGAVRAVMEAQATMLWLYRLLTELKVDVRVAHPQHVHLVTRSKQKCDRRDAENLSDLLYMGRIRESWVAEGIWREARILSRERIRVRQERTRLKNKVHATLMAYNLNSRWTDIFDGKQGRRWLERVVEDELPAAEAMAVSLWLEQLDLLGQQQALLMEALEQVGPELPGYEHLTAVRGIGLVLATVILAEIGDIQRFKRPEQVAAYAGLVPTTRESAGKDAGRGITKAGSGFLRWGLTQSVQHMVRWCEGPWKTIYRKKARRLKKRKARGVMARKLAVATWYVLTRDEPFRFAGPPEVAAGAG
jgi:transposase